MGNLLAQTIERPVGSLRGIGPLGLEDRDPSAAQGIFVNAISLIIGFLTAVAIIWFVFQFILGAIGWISAGGDAKAVDAARSKITNAVVGVVIVLLALVIVSVVGGILGIDFLNLGEFLTKLKPQ